MNGWPYGITHILKVYTSMISMTQLSDVSLQMSYHQKALVDLGFVYALLCTNLCISMCSGKPSSPLLYWTNTMINNTC